MEQQAVIDFFDQAAAGWDAQLVRNEAVIGQILDNAGIRPGVSVLDVACGTGVLIPDYLKRGAAQITKQMGLVCHVRERRRYNFTKVRSEKWPRICRNDTSKRMSQTVNGLQM